MPEESSPFEQKALEADMRRLAEEIGRERERPESRSSSEHELLRQSLRAITPPPTPPAAPSPQQDEHGALPAYAAQESAETKLEIEYLIDMALREGIIKAARVAQKSNPFVEDAFHDALAGKLYPELQRRGILK